MLRSKTQRLSALFLILAVASFFSVDVVHAQVFVPGNGPPAAGSLGDILISVLSKLALVNTFMHILLLMALQFVGYFFQADFFVNDAMMQALFKIWQLSRNIMNIIFAVMLIGVSFYVIITAKSDMIKEKLVQFVMAVILVNMSWFFPRVILDVANVLSATVFSIPHMLQSGPCMMLDENNVQVPCTVITNVKLFPGQSGGIWDPDVDQFCSENGAGSPGSASCPCISSIECHVVKEYDAMLRSGEMTSAHAMINGLAVSFGKISQLAKVPTTIAGANPIGASQSVQVSMQIALSILMAFIVQAVLVLPLLGLAVGLLIRIIVIWVTTAFMPFVFLGYVINGKLGTDIFGFETNIWQEFINAAFLPAMVGIPMTIGFIMLTTVSTIVVAAPGGGLPFEMNVPILNGVGSWWPMVWLFVAITIIWKGSFDALKKVKFAEKFTEKIRGFGETIGGAAAQLPLLTPLPLPGNPNATLGTVVSAAKLAPDAMRATASGLTGKSFAENWQQIMSQHQGVGGITNANTRSPQDLAKVIDNDRVMGDKMVKAIETLKTTQDTDQRKAALTTIMNHMGGATYVDALTRLQQGMPEFKQNTVLQNLIRNDLQAIIAQEQQSNASQP